MRLLLRSSRASISLSLSLSLDSQLRMGGRGVGRKREGKRRGEERREGRPIQVASSETDGRMDRQREEERDKPIED